MRNPVTFHKEVGGRGGRPGHKLVLPPVPKVDVPDAERVRELPAADLTPVGRLDLHAVLQPLVREALVVHSDLEGDGVSLLSVQVLQHRGDEYSCRQRTLKNTTMYFE